MDNYVLPKKSDFKKLSVEDIKKEPPDLKNINCAKAKAVANWIMEWIDESLKNGTVDTQTLLPLKPELAYLLGVSIGTIQNALRIVEDKGYAESKQCLGTVIKNPKENTSRLRKLTSKRQISVGLIKKYICDTPVRIGEELPPVHELAEFLHCSIHTTRLALAVLCEEKIVEHEQRFGANNGWKVISKNFEKNNFAKEKETLVTQVEKDIKKYITENLKVGDRLPAHHTFTSLFKVSLKTLHDALSNLAKEGVVESKRGRYGTSVTRMPNEMPTHGQKETSIFTQQNEQNFYYYEKTLEHIKKIITENYQIGEKLPAATVLAKEMNLSPNTIRKALKILAEEGYVTSTRGRYGGTFVIEIPENDEEAYKWLAVNPQYTQVYNRNSGFETGN